jgi:hypothetical protein
MDIYGRSMSQFGAVDICSMHVVDEHLKVSTGIYKQCPIVSMSTAFNS